MSYQDWLENRPTVVEEESSKPKHEYANTIINTIIRGREVISISVRKDSIEVTGHAVYAPPGKDIVCAGVSALTQTLISSIEALTDDHIGHEAEGGKATIEFRNPSEQTKLLIDSFFIGVSLIADEYPDHVRIV